MITSCSSGLLQGRPYGGIGYMWHKSLNNFIEFLSSGCDGRIIAFKLHFNGFIILLFNVYFPCCDNSVAYRNDLNLIIG